LMHQGKKKNGRRILISTGIFLFLLTPATGKSDQVRILTANLTSGYHQAYEEPGINILQGLKPDVVLIQEFNYEQGSISSFVDDFFGEEFSYYRESGRRLPNGIISRWPIKSSGSWNDEKLSDREFAWAVIDIPGDVDLQAVSVHLKAGGDNSDESKRTQEASALREYISRNFDSSQYIVVGGDLNLQDVEEPALDTFRDFLSPTTHIPLDTRGNMYTNRDQSKPYDWIMPNALLDARHDTLVIGQNSFPKGLVFNSWFYTPLTDVTPISRENSQAIGMQHMAVLKTFDIPGDGVPPPGDYDGDGTTEPAVFRPDTGLWLIRGMTRFYLGGSDDTPVPQDYDGDGTWEAAYFRKTQGFWKARGITRCYFGNSTDIALPGDYDGDHTAEPAVFSPPTGLWKVRNITRLYFGTSRDIPAAADFDGDGRRDIAWFRPDTGLWKVRGSTFFYFGSSADIPVCGDYDGNGSEEAAWFRPDNGLWKVRGLTQCFFGTAQDIPVPGDFNGDGTIEPSYFRNTQILWKARGTTRLYFGKSLDKPVSNPYIFSP